MEKKALGKGLSALIPEKETKSVDGNVSYLKIDLIKDNNFQPRTNYDKEKLENLKASIKEKGVLQPILVRPKKISSRKALGEEKDSTDEDIIYEVVAGERRLKAARSLNLDKVPVIVKDVSDQEALVIALVENIQREELNPIEEAEAYKKLIEMFSYTQETIAHSVGKDRSTISNILRLLKLPVEIQNKVSQGALSIGHARALLSVDSTSDQKRLCEKAVKKALSVRQLENEVTAISKRSNSKNKEAKQKSYEIVALEEALQKLLGTKVRVLNKKDKGKIIIDYYSFLDLERIINIIKK